MNSRIKTYGPRTENGKKDRYELKIAFPNPQLREQIKRWQAERWDCMIMDIALRMLDFDKFKQAINAFGCGHYDDLSERNGHAPTESEFAQRKDELLDWIGFLGSERTTNITEAEMWANTINYINKTIEDVSGEKSRMKENLQYWIEKRQNDRES